MKNRFIKLIGIGLVLYALSWVYTFVDIYNTTYWVVKNNSCVKPATSANKELMPGHLFRIGCTLIPHERTDWHLIECPNKSGVSSAITFTTSREACEEFIAGKYKYVRRDGVLSLEQ